MTPLKLLVTVGSDHHPFDRLIGWVDEWLDSVPSAAVQAVIQHGSAAPPRHGRANRFLAHEILLAELRQADVVVAQGGPMGIVEARRQGLTPIVVPRLRLLGEVVDDHQRDFCHELGRSGDLILAESQSVLSAALDRAMAAPGTLRAPPETVDETILQSVGTFAELVAALPRRRPRLFRRP